MQTYTSFIRKALILAGHLIEAHLGTQLVRPELLLGVVGPVFIERVAPQSSHRGPFGIALLFPPRIRPLPWVGGTLSCRVGICIGTVALPEVTLPKHMYRCWGRGWFPLRAFIGSRNIGVIPAHPHLVKAWSSTWSTAGCAVWCSTWGLA